MNSILYTNQKVKIDGIPGVRDGEEIVTIIQETDGLFKIKDKHNELFTVCLANIISYTKKGYNE